jgi:cytochrome c biogenesis protein CcdA
MGKVVPTPTPTTQTHTSNATGNATTKDYVTASNSQDGFPLPLFVTTGIISGLNPCVFSVLIFLMGTLALTGSRARALAIGMVYIATVFFVFFLSALAVVQFVRIIGAQNLQLTKTIIGVFLLVVGIVSIKDFFWYIAGLVLRFQLLRNTVSAISEKPVRFSQLSGSVSSPRLPLCRAQSVRSRTFPPHT